jgi:hypothetical protein
MDTIAAVHPVGPGADRCGVEARIGLGHGETGLFPTGDQRRQHPGPLLGRSEQHDRVKAEDIDMDGRRARHAGTRASDRFHDERGFRHAETRAAIFGRHRHAEQAGSGDGGVKVMRENARAVVLGPVAVGEIGRDPARKIGDRLLLAGQSGPHFVVRICSRSRCHNL